ncbi:MAG: M10 family metallopeptidase [Cypionkella sp.]|nr:M10 family metallopeptidase [Cypionkella sp.]
MCFICAQRDPSNALAGVAMHASGGTPSLITDDPIWAGLGVVSEGADAADNTNTTYSLEVGQSATGSISSALDQDWFAIDLVAGQSYDFRLLGFGNAYLGDPYLWVMDASGTQVAEKDDGFTSFSGTHEWDSALEFTATYTGTYYLQAAGFSSATGDYLLSATPLDPAGFVLTVDEIAWQLINNGAAFFNSDEAVAFDIGMDNSLSVDLSGLTAEGQTLATAALDIWAAYLGITFTPVLGGAEITFDDDDEGAFASTTTGGGNIVSAEVNVGLDWLEDGTALNDYPFETYLHEIGHALGLAHAGNYNGDAIYGTDNYYLNDSLAWTIMSYMQAQNDDGDGGNLSDWNTYVDASFQDMYSPMIADIIAMQYLYGVSNSTFTGDTTYGFDGTTGIEALDDAATTSGALMAMTILDTGGNDTLDFSQTAAHQVISLAAESLSSVLGGRHNVGIARGVVIENAISGSGNDVLIGNAASNQLMGGSGDDSLYGGAGDTLYGGAGNDVFILDAGTVTIDDQDGENEVRVSAAIDLTLADLLDIRHATLLGTANLGLTGDEAGNILRGNSGQNLITADIGNDTIYAGGGNDTLYGGAGDDVYYIDGMQDVVDDADGYDVVFSDATVNLSTIQNTALRISGVEKVQLLGTANLNLFGDTAANHLVGNAGNNSISGGAGNDTLQGGSGNDIYEIDTLNDVIIETSGRDEVRGALSMNLIDARFAGIEDAWLNGTAGYALTGDAVANRLNGNSGGNTIKGDAGNDTVNGYAGNDLLYGGSSSDKLYGGTNNDSLDGGSSADSLYGGDQNDVLYGGSSGDKLYGGSGKDRLQGGTSKDYLYGGADADTFDFNAMSEMTTSA